MQLAVTRFDTSLPLPEYQTKGSVGFDLCSRVDMTIDPHTIALIPLNLVVQIPDGYMLLVVPRSSTPKKKQLLIPHGIGVVDQDYCGPEDEIKFQAYNFSDQPVTIEKGERIAQGLLVRVGVAEIVEKEVKSKTSRGGFGSTK